MNVENVLKKDIFSLNTNPLLKMASKKVSAKATAKPTAKKAQSKADADPEPSSQPTQSSLPKEPSDTTGEILGTFEHALRRPDTYIGSVRTSKVSVFTFDDATKTAKLRKITFNPGLFQIIKEIGSNAIDNKWRSEQKTPDTPLKHIDITIDMGTGRITIVNDGYCIPCNKTKYTFAIAGGGSKTIEVFPVEAFFGYINSGTNYNDNTIRKTSGKNGMGGTLANIYSSEFEVEAANHDDHTKVIVKFKNNGNPVSVSDTPFAVKSKKIKGYTRVSFVPDYAYFNYPVPGGTGENNIDDNLVSVIKLYAYEIAMITNTPVKFTLEDSSLGRVVIDPSEEDQDVPIAASSTALSLQNTPAVNSTISTEIIKVASLEKYARLFYPDSSNKIAYFKSPSGDECVLVENISDSAIGANGSNAQEVPPQEEMDSIAHISFVNGLRTKKGGVHVTAWQEAIIGNIVRTFNARKPKNKKTDPVKTTARAVYPYLTIFLRCEVDRPKFDDQTKDFLNEIVDENGAKAKYRLYNPSNKKQAEQWKGDLEIALAKIMKWSFVRHLDEKLSLKADIVSKKDGNVKSRVHCGSKYLGANFAGVPGEAHKCTLWPSEGDAAKTTVSIGISNMENGFDYNGVFALKGKMINVAKHGDNRVAKNAEIKMLTEILGLRKGVDYRIKENLLTLRYGRMIMATDQDDDGHHIKGLIMNFIATYHPTLIPTGFLRSLSTAVVVLPPKGISLKAGQSAKSHASQTKRSEEAQKLFFSNPDYARWQETASEAEKKKYGRPIYYKGLGSIPPRVTHIYFRTPRLVEYLPHNPDEEDMLKQNFLGGQEAILWRKTEILKGVSSALDPLSIVERIEPNFKYEGKMTTNEFVLNQSMIYNRICLPRAIPCIWDGFKDSQRKALFGVFVENPRDPQNVEELTCGVKKYSAYHHAGKSLSDTIIKMSQGFVGANNIPYFTLDGQMGSRAQGGADASHPRYPFTKLEDIVRHLFVAEDTPLLPKNFEGSKEIEPMYYVPVVCTLLINGGDGVGVGWSSTIPSFNPEDVIARTEEFIDFGIDRDGSTVAYETQYPRMVPWYRGFTGQISNITDKNGKVSGWISRGILKECTEPGYKGWWEITEMPIGLWTDTLLLWMQYLETGNPPEGKTWKKRDVRAISEYRKNVRFNSVHIWFKPTKDFTPDIDTPGNFAILKSKGSYSNMWAIDENSYPHHFETPEEILVAFCKKRYFFYQLRYNSMMKVYEDEKLKAHNQYRFVKAIVEKELDITSLSNEELDALLSNAPWQFDRIFGKRNGNGSSGEDVEKINTPLAGFSYLFDIQIRSMTKSKFEDLFSEYEKYAAKIEMLLSKTPRDLWKDDIRNLREAYQRFLITRDDNIVIGEDAPGKLSGKKAARKRVK